VNSTRKWFEAWGEAEAQNAFLRMLLFGALLGLVTQVAALTFLALRPPILIGLSSKSTEVLSQKEPAREILELEVRRWVEGYVTTHYNWTPQTIDTAFQKASNYVSQEQQKAFWAANTTQLKVAKDKGLSQRFYISSLKLDLDKRRASIEGERVLVVESLRAASIVNLSLSFQLGPRTVENPEGIYISSENLVDGGNQ